MMRFLIPLILALLGLGAGVGAGMALRPAPDPAPEGEAPEASPAKAPLPPDQQPEYVKLSNQFVVPLVQQGRVASMVVLSISLEVPPGGSKDVFSVEPKLRDGMLRVLFDHANAGGFSGAFTETANLVTLRRALSEVARSTVGPQVSDVLITDIMRQDG